MINTDIEKAIEYLVDKYIDSGVLFNSYEDTCSKILKRRKSELEELFRKPNVDLDLFEETIDNIFEAMLNGKDPGLKNFAPESIISPAILENYMRAASIGRKPKNRQLPAKLKMELISHFKDSGQDPRIPTDDKDAEEWITGVEACCVHSRSEIYLKAIEILRRYVK